jgi:hypothetical protein
MSVPQLRFKEFSERVERNGPHKSWQIGEVYIHVMLCPK